MLRARRLMVSRNLSADEAYDRVILGDELASYRRRQAQDAKRLDRQLERFLRRERSRRREEEGGSGRA